MISYRNSLVFWILFLPYSALSAGQSSSAPPPEFFQTNGIGKPLVISSGDVLNIRFYYNPELNKVVKVRDDGKISLDLLQGIQVAGDTPEELQKKLVVLYSKEFTNPELTVDVDSRANSSVYVTGEVLLPGPKELRGKMTVAMVLASSQVSQKSAATKSVFLIRSVEAGKYQVYKMDASFPAGAARGVEMAPGDILFIPRKGIVKADDFMDQYVRQLLPATPSANASLIYTTGNPIVSSAAAASH